MRTNTTKAKMAAGQVAFGAIIGRHAPDLVELFGPIGYDFVMIDGEHGSMSLDDVEHMVRAAARYHPEGHRGVAGGRPHDYGVGVSREQSTRWINDQLLVIPMIEETRAVDNLDSILTVSGIDVLHVASGDLGQSMGNPEAGAVRQVMRQAIPRIRAGGKLVGVGGNSPSDAAGVAEFIALGANLVTISSLGLLRLGAEDFRRRVQEATGGPRPSRHSRP
jgi:4-hydroxy-2-oxoheptanedioate aldolase